MWYSWSGHALRGAQGLTPPYSWATVHCAPKSEEEAGPWRSLLVNMCHASGLRADSRLAINLWFSVGTQDLLIWLPLLTVAPGLQQSTSFSLLSSPAWSHMVLPSLGYAYSPAVSSQVSSPATDFSPFQPLFPGLPCHLCNWAGRGTHTCLCSPG